MSQVEINQFIQNIADKQVSYDLKRFFEIIHKEFFKNVDISFMNYFLELIEKQDEFCVNHSKLYEYNVITLNKKENTKEIKNCLVEDNDFVEGEDYLVGEVPHQSETSRGVKYSNVYMLKPKTFKFCLMRSKNCKQYSKYYLLLEEMYLYFTKYEKAYKDVLLSGKNCQINELIKKVDNQNEQIQELLNYGKEANEKLDENNYILRVTNKELEDTSKDVKKLKKVIKQVFPKTTKNPKDDNKTNYFRIVQLRDSVIKNDSGDIKSTLMIISGQKKHVETKTTIKDGEIGKYKPVSEITYIPNGIHLQNLLKEHFKKEFVNKVLYEKFINENLQKYVTLWKKNLQNEIDELEKISVNDISRKDKMNLSLKKKQINKDISEINQLPKNIIKVINKDFNNIGKNFIATSKKISWLKNNFVNYSDFVNWIKKLNENKNKEELPENVP